MWWSARTVPRENVPSQRQSNGRQKNEERDIIWLLIREIPCFIRGLFLRFFGLG